MFTNEISFCDVNDAKRKNELLIQKIYKEIVCLKNLLINLLRYANVYDPYDLYPYVCGNVHASDLLCVDVYVYVSHHDDDLPNDLLCACDVLYVHVFKKKEIDY